MERLRRIARAWAAYKLAQRKFNTTAQGLGLARTGNAHWSKRQREAWEHAFDRDYRTMIHRRRALRMALTPSKLRVSHA